MSFNSDADRNFKSGLDNSRSPAVEDDAAIQAPADLPLHPLKAAPQPDDAGVEREHLHPVDFPAPPSPYETDVVAELEDFAGYIAAMKEEDYGDWMRRANMYWMNLKESLLRGAPDQAEYVERELGRMKETIQFCPTFQILETQRRVIEMALEMRQHLGGEGEFDLHKFQVSTAEHTIPNAPPWSPMLENPEEADIQPYIEGGDLSINGEFMNRGDDLRTQLPGNRE